MNVFKYFVRNITNFTVFFISVVYCSSYNGNISDAIFAGYDSGLRPVCGSSTQVNATLGIALRQVIDLDEPNQVIKLNLWIRLKWQDCLLSWDPADYGGIGNIIVPYKRIWVPDLTLYDSIATEFYGMADYRPNIYSDGTVYYNFPTVIEALCPIDVTSFPFDTQTCSLVFGSWSYHGFHLDFLVRDSGDMSSMKDNVEWEVPKITAERHVAYYGCCPEPYPDVTFYITLDRKPAFYVTNIILPSLMITVLLILGFILPVSSGEKVSLEITVMLAMSVFQLLVADKLPPSAEATPWIVIFFNFILGLSGVSTVLQVVVINIFYRGSKKVPEFIMKYIIVPACVVTFVNLPGKKYSCFCCRNKEACHSFWIGESGKQNGNKVDDESKETIKEKVCIEEVTDEEEYAEIWKCFSNAVDRLSLGLFSFTLAIGCITIFDKIV